jgi:NAD(P)-dependent dehydrogenase (short-subunit alcohol dehydrogenase family)
MVVFACFPQDDANLTPTFRMLARKFDCTSNPPLPAVQTPRSAYAQSKGYRSDPVKDFKYKIAVVTGAASGIGRGMAETFIAAGMKVVLADIEQGALEETTRLLLAAGADVHPVVTDVSKADQVEILAKRTLDKYGAVHILCNNAGVSVRGGPSWQSSLDDWQWILGVNLMGVVHGIRSFLPIMIKQDTEAHIVNTASMAGLIANTALYGTTKFAVVGLSEALYLELQRGRFKPRISVLCPGFVDTNIINAHRNRPTDSEESPQPQGRVAQAINEWMAEQLKQGMTPRSVGDQVLAAIRDERFYILTHPHYNPLIEQRMKDILSASNPTFVPTPGMESLMRKLNALSISAIKTSGLSAD